LLGGGRQDQKGQKEVEPPLLRWTCWEGQRHSGNLVMLMALTSSGTSPGEILNPRHLWQCRVKSRSHQFPTHATSGGWMWQLFVTDKDSPGPPLPRGVERWDPSGQWTLGSA
jgi:hypothetical protein